MPYEQISSTSRAPTYNPLGLSGTCGKLHSSKIKDAIFKSSFYQPCVLCHNYNTQFSWKPPISHITSPD